MTPFPSGTKKTGGAWLSSARVVRCWVKSRNERNPYDQLLTGKAEDSDKTAGDNSEEGGDDVKSSCPLCSGLHTCYNGRYNRQRTREGERIPKAGPSSDCRLQLAYTKLELLVIADQNAAVNARCWGAKLVGAAANALSIPPGEYGRKNETQRN